MLWTILGWIVFGLIAGFIARAIVPGKDDIGVLRTILLGIAGSIVGGLVFGLLTVGLRGFQPAGWIGSVIGAVDHGLRPTPARPVKRSGCSSTSPGVAGRHCGRKTTPGSTSSNPSKNPVTSSVDRIVSGVAVRSR